MEETALAQVQAWMQSSLIDPATNSDNTIINELVEPSKTLSPEQRLNIYQQSYYGRLIECMRQQFKALEHTLDDDLFVEFCRMYLKEYPSFDPSLAHLGDKFPAFLQSIRPDKENPEKWIDFMIAMAQFELDLYTIFDQEGSENDQFATALDSDTSLQFQKCFSFHMYPFAVNLYYQEVAAGDEPEIKNQEDTYVAFLRTNYQVYVVPLNVMQFNLLGMIQKEASIAEALEKFTKHYNLVPEVVSDRWQEWRSYWIEKGFFIV